MEFLNFETLPGQKYLRSNCIAACQQAYMLEVCNCTLDILFPTGDYKLCNITALKCLSKYDSEQLNFTEDALFNINYYYFINQ